MNLNYFGVLSFTTRNRRNGDVFFHIGDFFFTRSKNKMPHVETRFSLLYCLNVKSLRVVFVHASAE